MNDSFNPRLLAYFQNKDLDLITDWNKQNFFLNY